MNEDLRDTVQRAIGWLAALAFVALAGISMLPDYDMTMHVIVGVIVVIAMLLGKIDRITDLVDKWRNG